MSQNIIESIFSSKESLDEEYPNFPGVKTFDLHKKHLLYGRIDKDGDAVYLDDSNLAQVHGGPSTHFAADFVCKAFSDLRKSIGSFARGYQWIKNGLYPVNLIAHRSWRTGDLEYNYNQHLNSLYRTFVDSYLTVDRRVNRIKDFKSFVKEFLRFSLKTAQNFPITKTGYLTSMHCSPFVSGLMLEIASERHGLGANGRVLEYINEPTFAFFVNEFKKFGFMVDKNAPWRLVFNLASGMKDKKETGKLTGGQVYMDRFAVNYDNIFKTYYRKAYLDELLNIKNKLWTLYNAFYLQFSTYESIEYCVADSSAAQGRAQPSFSLSDEVLGRIKVVSKRLERQPPPTIDARGFFVQPTALEEEEYWLKILLKLRMAETGALEDVDSFNFHIKKVVEQSRLFGHDASIKYINELTKGMHVTNFLIKGSYWYGMDEKEFEKRKKMALDDAVEPSITDFSLTGNANLEK